jgi:hypothetical protein
VAHEPQGDAAVGLDVHSGGAAMSNELFDLAAEIRAETKLAYLLFDGNVQEWVPKSQVEDNGDGTFTMPQWLAEEKGFV